MQDYSFKPGWKISVGFLVVFGLFVRLGLWQIHRADEKQALIDARAERSRDIAIELTGREASLEDLRYRRVVVAGRYDADHQFLLDNQINGQQLGFHVLTPLQIADSDRAVLVNRGWRPWGADRERAPDLGIGRVDVRIAGMVERFPAVGLKLKGADIPSPGWPSVVQVAEPERLAERLGYPVLPYQVLLDPTAADGYARDWTVTPLNPDTNRGYALQWFLFAAVAAVLYIRYGFKAGPSAATR